MSSASALLSDPLPQPQPAGSAATEETAEETSYKEGFEAGRNRGRSDGYTEGYRTGYQEGHRDGRSGVGEQGVSFDPNHPANPDNDLVISTVNDRGKAHSVAPSEPPRHVLADPHKVDYAPAEISSPSTDRSLPPAESSPADPNAPFPDQVVAVVHTDPSTGQQLSPAKPGGVGIPTLQAPNNQSG